ncbi:MAG: S41 family peptidase [Prosthecobacter sp.]|uniref:S41 family peptidase n=1 Tax=Prosthecobacter sp. TaxID=1965333 RepID=UPI0039024005
MIRLCLLLSLICTCASLPAQEPRSAAADNNEGSRALWAEFMTCLQTDYFEPIDELDLTRKAVDLLAAESPVFASLPKPQDYGKGSDDHRRAFHQYVLAVAVKAGRKINAVTAVELAIQRLCERHLRFSDYTPASVMAELDSLAKAKPGMSVKAGKNGRFTCLPFPGEAADLASIRYGDELIAVDGVLVEGMSLPKLGTKIYGSDGSKVEVRVRQSTGRIITAQLTRRLTGGLRITVVTGISGTTVKIPNFDSNTVPDLREILKKLKPSVPLTVDLRGNGGGSIPAAVDAAALLIDGPRPLILGKQQHRSRPAVDLVSNEPMIPGFKRLLILMDGGTASSSELFIALLKEAGNLKVALSGACTYGKDLWLEVFLLKSGGGEFALPVGTLLTQGGKGWPQGIEPTMGVKK